MTPKISAYFAIAILIILTSALVLIFMKIRRVSKDLNKEALNDLKEKGYSELTKGLKYNKISAFILLWKPLGLVRWLLTVIILLTLKSLPTI